MEGFLGMTPDLETALAEIDRVFAGDTCEPDNVCSHCYADEDRAALAVPGAPIDPVVLASWTYEGPYMVEDHAALVRRILPQMARGMVDGTVHVYWAAQHALVRGDWRDWPESQRGAIQRFVDAWWQDLITTAEPHHAIMDAFEQYAAVVGLELALAAWPDDAVADAHLAAVDDWWLSTLLRDENPFRGLGDLYDEQNLVVTVQQWYLDFGVGKLQRVGAVEMAAKASLLALPSWEDRLNHVGGMQPTPGN
jgi:hypothetical protein